MSKPGSKAYGLTSGGLIVPGYQIPKTHITSAPAAGDDSAGGMLRRLAQTILEWREELPEDAQPVITAIASGGVQIMVERMSQESHHGIRIEGNSNGNPCMLLVHQANLELLCYIEKVQDVEFRRKIGFIIDGEESEV
ncbi:MAG: hypothetical protein HKN88_01480 [Gammaproteobacteria bacterium]|nr:hypothetical protein [Gammaproteobacteria bacterium]NNC96720.1 hypothetical protein [Gammaproteobacteria bacterium]NNM14305.1 hypothetical protein [Gammaproteobacteria bacterium]